MDEDSITNSEDSGEEVLAGPSKKPKLSTDSENSTVTESLDENGAEKFLQLQRPELEARQTQVEKAMIIRSKLVETHLWGGVDVTEKVLFNKFKTVKMTTYLL